MGIILTCYTKLLKEKVINNYNLTLKSMYLLKQIAEQKNIDLSKIDYDKDITKKLYRYNGRM